MFWCGGEIPSAPTKIMPLPTDEKIKRIREIELKINKNLFVICGIVTVVTMVMILTEFFTRGSFPPTQISLFYLGVLVIYSVHKELLRWLGERKLERQGEIYVYSWIALTTILYTINFLSKDFFNYSPAGEPLYTLKEISIISFEVLVIFIITRGSKLIKIGLTK